MVSEAIEGAATFGALIVTMGGTAGVSIAKAQAKAQMKNAVKKIGSKAA